MNDQDKTKDQLIAELVELRQHVAEQNVQLAQCQQSEADRRYINDSLPVLVATAGLDGYYKEVNAAFERILGWPEEESLSRPFIEFVHPDDQAAAVVTFERLKSGETVTNFVDRNVCKDGSYRWFNWAVIPVLDRRIVFGIGRDISAERQAEEALQKTHDKLEERVEERTAALAESNRKLVATLESITDGFISCDHEWRCTYVNKAAEQYLRKTREELLGKVGWDVFPEASRLKFHPEFHRAVREKEAVQFEEFYPDPMNAWYECDCYPSSEGLSVFFRDISSRKRAEEALRHSEEKYRTLVEASPDAVVKSDLTGQVIFASPKAVELLGFGSLEELCTKRTLDFVVEEEHPQLVANLSNLAEVGVRRSTEYTGVRKDGTRFPMEISFALVRDAAGAPKAVMTVVRDITERKQAQAALQESEEKYRTLVETCPDAVVMTNLEGRIIFASRQAVELYGADSADEMCGMEATSLITHEERPGAKESIARLQREGLHRNLQYTFVRRDGTRFPGEMSSTVVYDATGRPRALMAVARDITERKQAQKALERERRTLFHMLRASDHERQLISYEIHDELAQQLASAIMQFQAYDDLERHDPGRAKIVYDAGVEMLREAHVEARRLISGVRPPILDESDIATAIAHLVYEHTKPGGPKVELHRSVKVERLAKVLENAIYRIAQEALANALQHSGSGRVEVSFVQHNGNLCLEVQDWGVGFDPGSVDENCFGLDGIRERARLLGGECSIESEPGKGTCVRVALPLLEEE